MYQLARATCFLVVLLAPLLVAQGSSAPVLAPGEDPCAMARQIAAQGPCVRAEDCGAFEMWKRAFGAPRIEPLQPELADRSRVMPRAYLCPASRASD